MSLAEKRARADQLRGELSQLRVEREAALQESSDAIAEAQVDAELERLEAEKQQAQLDLAVAQNGGSVEDAMAAMEAAAAPPVVAVQTEEVDKPVSPASIETAPDTPQPENITSPDTLTEAPTVEVLPDEPVVVPDDTASKDEEK